MGRVITTKKMLERMDTGRPFSMRWVTYDRKRRKGGRILEVSEARLTQPGQQRKAGRPLTPIEKTKAAGKRANHRKWYTRNIAVLHQGEETGEIIKFHPPLVLEFNGMDVIE